jgi:hypothetical protein
MAHAACELMWLKNLLTEIGIKVQMPMEILSKNQAAIHISSETVFHERTKHISVALSLMHFIREKSQAGLDCFLLKKIVIISLYH